MLKLIEFLTVQERRRFESIAISWTEIHNTNPDILREGSLRLPLVQFWNSCGFELSRTLKDQPEAGMFRHRSAQGPICVPAHTSSPPVCALYISNFQSEVSYSASRSEWLIRPAKWKVVFNLDRRFNNGTVLKRHRQDQHSQPSPFAYKIPPGLHLYNHHMIIFHDSIYSQPWPSIHLYLAGDRESPDFYRSKYG
jgi:hypothetical protein